MDWATIKPGLRAWVTAMTGLVSPRTSKPMVYWRDEPDAHRPSAYALLHVFGTTTIGTDGVRWVYESEVTPPTEGATPGAVVPMTTGNRQFTLSVEFRSLNQKDTERADVYSERLRNRVIWPRSQAMLKTINVGFIRSSDTRDLSFLVDQRQESRCVLDVRLSALIRETDSEGATGYFERAELTSRYAQDGAVDVVDGPVTLPGEDGGE